MGNRKYRCLPHDEQIVRRLGPLVASRLPAEQEIRQHGAWIRTMIDERVLLNVRLIVCVGWPLPQIFRNVSLVCATIGAREGLTNCSESLDSARSFGL
jgi:hypothetical protein